MDSTTADNLIATTLDQEITVVVSEDEDKIVED